MQKHAKGNISPITEAWLSLMLVWQHKISVSESGTDSLLIIIIYENSACFVEKRAMLSWECSARLGKKRVSDWAGLVGGKLGSQIGQCQSIWHGCLLGVCLNMWLGLTVLFILMWYRILHRKFLYERIAIAILEAIRIDETERACTSKRVGTRTSFLQY